MDKNLVYSVLPLLALSAVLQVVMGNLDLGIFSFPVNVALLLALGGILYVLTRERVGERFMSALASAHAAYPHREFLRDECRAAYDGHFLGLDYHTRTDDNLLHDNTVDFQEEENVVSIRDHITDIYCPKSEKLFDNTEFMYKFARLLTRARFFCLWRKVHCIMSNPLIRLI